MKPSIKLPREKITIGNPSKKELICRIRKLEKEGYTRVGPIYNEKNYWGITIFLQKMQK